ncbi:reverse transcriptase domain-containing protein [Thalassospira sp. SN3W]|uniref:reverse transcriptase domain-containing protein n=1 Tax=Thalassospira sp. SN3W TaxID=3035476 RepID=UPI00311ABCF6
MAFPFPIQKADLKYYPHFDAPISLSNIQTLVTDPVAVAQRKFYPFLMFEEEWQPYRSKSDGKPEKKTRPIRYGARGDAYIFSYYRHLLSEKYENRLIELGIEHCPIAYRKIPNAAQTGGKCNIDFAKDAVDKILEFGDCVTIAMDVKSFFESLDHKRIKALWKSLLDCNELPEDHYAVFKNITKYRYVDQKQLLRRLEYLRKTSAGKKSFEKLTIPFKKIPKQICSPSDFREKVCGSGGKYKSLIQYNDKDHGVPQGAPLSDLLANIYMMDFDLALNQYAKKLGGVYVRYSDDILIIVPGDEKITNQAINFAIKEITKYGKEIKIKDAKTCISKFEKVGERLKFTHIGGPQGKNGFEYLGFRFDGKNVYLRDSTVSRLYRKATAVARATAAIHVTSHPEKSTSQLVDSYDYSLFLRKFSRALKKEFSDDHKSWTFYTYAKRASRMFGAKGEPILKQINGFKEKMNDRVGKFILEKKAKIEI